MTGEAVEGFWNEERVNILKANWNTNSAGELALELGTTRGAVIGKAHRLKLAPKRRPPSPTGQRSRWSIERSKRRRDQKKASTEPLQAPEAILPPQPVEGGVHILDLMPHHCRAIAGSGSDGLAVYCGAQKEGLIRVRGGRILSSYCATHGNRYFHRPDSA